MFFAQKQRKDKVMKKVLPLILTVVLTLALVTSCGQSGGGESSVPEGPFDPENVKVMGRAPRKRDRFFAKNAGQGRCLLTE